MKTVFRLSAAALFCLPVHLAAQTTPPSEDPGVPRTPLPYDRGYDKDSPRTDAINAPNQAARSAANAAVAAQTAVRPDMSAEAKAQYDADMEAWRAAVRQQRREVAHADRQQRAYADAMFAWRVQVADCHHGVRAACDAPSPDPADFW